MALFGIQARLVEAGRIRLGEKQGNRPVKLTDAMRFTSRSKGNVAAVAGKYGTTVETVTINRETQYETKIPTAQVEVTFRLSGISQHYEAWTGGGCQIRVSDDGMANTVTGEVLGFDITDSDERDKRNIKAKTRMNLQVTGLDVIGNWRVETGGYFAAVETAGLIDLLTSAGVGPNQDVQATLRVELRKGSGKEYTVVSLTPTGNVAAIIDAVTEASEATAARTLAANTHTTTVAEATEAVAIDAAERLDADTVAKFNDYVTGQGLDEIEIAGMVYAVTDGRTADVTGVRASELDALRVAAKVAVAAKATPAA